MRKCFYTFDYENVEKRLKISATKNARDTKFGRQFLVYNTLIKFISNQLFNLWSRFMSDIYKIRLSDFNPYLAAQYYKQLIITFKPMGNNLL